MATNAWSGWGPVQQAAASAELRAAQNSGNIALGGNIGASAGNSAGLVAAKSNYGQPFTPTAPSPQYTPDVNTYDPNNLSGWGKNFGSDRAAYEAYGRQMELEPQIDAVYNPQFDYLNQTEQFYKNQLPGYQAEAGKNYDVNKQLLGTSLSNAQTGIQNQETTGKRATEDAMAKARRVFMEQQIGNQQRFGGSSSAGGAMSELLARNLQSEQGQIGRQATDYTQQIGQLRQQAQQKFDDSVLQLEQQKQKALNDIQREFDQKMMEIGSNRTQLTSAKAQMKLQALMDLRNQTFAIQQQEAQFKQALQLQLAQSGQLGQAGVGIPKTLQQNAGLDSYGLTYDNKKVTQPYDQPLQGPMGRKIVGRDELNRYVYSDGAAGWTPPQGL